MDLNKIYLFLFFILMYPLTTLHSQVTYEFCMSAKYGKTIVLDFKVHNNTAAPVPNYNFVFNWKGVSNAIMYSGLDVIQNGDNGIVELQKTTWGSPLPIGTTVFSVTMDYEVGMFPPDEGTFNGNIIKGITCYTPPAHENFSCERNFNDACTVKPIGPVGHEIKIGEGSVFAWQAPLQVYIPENKKGWAIGMAVSHSLFTNLMGFDVMSINEYFATAIQESNAGCEGSQLVAPAWVTTTYPHHDTNNPTFCYDKTGAVAVGYFQQEMIGSWDELSMNYPCFVPQVTKDSFISTPNVGSSFEFQSIMKAYHDYRNVAYWQYVKCWNPIEFIKTSQDPYAAVKIIGMAYNQGMNHNSFGEIFDSNRTDAVNATNLMDKISPATPTATNRLYAEQINRLTKVLDDNVAAIDWQDAAVFGVTNRTAHSFRGFYDAQIAWSDVEEYIKKVTPFYAPFGVDEASFIAAVKPAFDHINGGNSISFRYQMSEVVEAIVVYLPAFDPKKGLGEVYGGSGANGCFAPTAKMDGFDANCGQDLSLKVYFSGQAPYTFKYKRTDVSPEIVYPDITTSQNPYTITPVNQGTYSLISVSDSVSTGEVVCNTVQVKNIGSGVTAQLLRYGGNPCTGSGEGIEVEIISSDPAPYTIEYEISGNLHTAVINSNHEVLIAAPAPAESYQLKKVTINGCETLFNNSGIIDLKVPPVVTADLTEFGKDICLGITSGIHIEVKAPGKKGPFIIDYELDGVAQSSVTIAANTEILIPLGGAAGEYHITNITIGNCNFAVDETIKIDAVIVPVLDVKVEEYGGDFCSGINEGVQVKIVSNLTGTFVLNYEIDGVSQPPVTTMADHFVLFPEPAPAGTYKLTKIIVNNCEFPLNKELVLNDSSITPKVKIEGYLFLCHGGETVLKAAVDTSIPAVLSYQWKRNNVDIEGADEIFYVTDKDGEYTVMITHKDGCTFLSPIAEVAFITNSGCGTIKPRPSVKPEYLKFFTPNGDGFNDTWHITNLDKFRKTQIQIFDRYGKLITELTETTDGWNGASHGNPVLATDYWFLMIYEDRNEPGVKKQFKDHFSLKR